VCQERIAVLVKKREDERNKFKIAAEKRAAEEREHARLLEEKRRADLLALQLQMAASRADRHAADDAWSRFHIHLIVRPMPWLPAYCCTCRFLLFISLEETHLFHLSFLYIPLLLSLFL